MLLAAREVMLECSGRVGRASATGHPGPVGGRTGVRIVIGVGTGGLSWGRGGGGGDLHSGADVQVNHLLLKISSSGDTC